MAILTEQVLEVCAKHAAEEAKKDFFLAWNLKSMWHPHSGYSDFAYGIMGSGDRLYSNVYWSIKGH